MSTRGIVASGVLVVSLLLVGSALAGTPDPAMSSLLVTKSQTYPAMSCYGPGTPKDYVTVVPNGMGETFAGTGITIEVIVRDASGQACALGAALSAASLVRRSSVP